MKHPLTVFIGYSLLTLILTHPFAFNLNTTVPNDIGDPLLNTWILAWDIHALLTSPRHFFEANIFYPLPQTLAYSEHLLSTALLSLPVQVYEPLWAYNLSLLSSFPLSAFGMYLLTLQQTRHRQAAFVAGFIFAFAPYRFAAIAHLQLLTFQWLPFTLLSLNQLTGQRSIFKQPFFYIALIFGVSQLLACWYLAVYMGLVLLIYLHFNKNTLTIYLVSLSLMALLSLPWARPYLQLMPTLRQARPLDQALTLAAHPTDFLAAAPFNTFWGNITEVFRQRPNFTEENTLFLGLIAPLLALLAWRQVRLWLLLLLTIALTFAWPYTLLATLIPPSTVIRVPPRWIIPALFALSGLAGYGSIYLFSRVRPKAQTPLFIGLCCGLFLESLSWPLPLAPVTHHATLSPAYHWLAQRPHPFALLELPMYHSPEYPEVKRLYASTLGWWKLVNGYSGYTPPRQAALAQAMADFPADSALNALPPLATPLPLYLLVHPDEMNRASWEDQLRWEAAQNPRLKPVGEFAGDYLYEFQNPQFATPPLARFTNGLELLSYETLTMAPNQPSLILYWRPTQPITTPLTVFIHFRAPDGYVRGQADSPPLQGHSPMTRWAVGQVIQDVHLYPLLDYDHIALGLYDPVTQIRLNAITAQGQTDTLILK